MMPTIEEISNEPAGRRFDSWVMARVFGRTMSMVVEVPPYSTDISAAWEVVEKMSEKFTFNLTKFLKTACWDCKFYVLCGCGVIVKEHKSFGETEPLAICRAALLAVREEREK